MMSFLVLKWFFLRKSYIWAPLSWPPGRQQHPKIHAQTSPKMYPQKGSKRAPKTSPKSPPESPPMGGWTTKTSFRPTPAVLFSNNDATRFFLGPKRGQSSLVVCNEGCTILRGRKSALSPRLPRDFSARGLFI